MLTVIFPITHDSQVLVGFLASEKGTLSTTNSCALSSTKQEAANLEANQGRSNNMNRSWFSCTVKKEDKLVE